MLKKIIICALLLAKPLFSDDNPHRVYIGPSWQNLNSIWANDTKQRGGMWGAIIGYDYQNSNDFYGGIDFTYMQGKLRGSAGNDPTREYFVEGRLGYTIAPCCYERFNFIPYIGAGYCVFDQHIGGGEKFRSRFWYVPFGIRMDYFFNAHWKLGLRAFVGPMFSGRWKITGGQDSSTFISTALSTSSGSSSSSSDLTSTEINAHEANVWLIWKVELPITFSTCLYGKATDISFVPYVREWAYRNKGLLIGQKNIYAGAQIQFGYHF